MYEKLINRLRNRRICIQQSGSLDDFLLLKEAADAVESMSEMVADAYSTIANMEADKPCWIPVTERLPEEKHAVLVWQPQYLNSYVVVLSDGEWFVYGGYGTKVFGVTHWMPLPEPPKED